MPAKTYTHSRHNLSFKNPPLTPPRRQGCYVLASLTGKENLSGRLVFLERNSPAPRRGICVHADTRIPLLGGVRGGLKKSAIYDARQYSNRIYCKLKAQLRTGFFGEKPGSWRIDVGSHVQSAAEGATIFLGDFVRFAQKFKNSNASFPGAIIVILAALLEHVDKIFQRALNILDM